jgi:H+-translocating NAD(P) transhydrogenase subunit alpha
MVTIAAIKETQHGEARCALSPDAIKKFVALGARVCVQAGAGVASDISDAAFVAAGATVVASAEEAVSAADILLCVVPPEAEQLRADLHVVGMFAPLDAATNLQPYADKAVQCYAMELLPRISRAQSMDVLSSQSNLAGYRAVIDAAAMTCKAMPMMMTAAGTIPPAKVLVLGAGVAGLQAIATAKRMGAVVSAFDVRPAVKEQVLSLGAKFIDVPPSDAATAETAGGYAKEMDDDYKRRQEQAIAEIIRTQDIVIATALIPGKQAPELITPEMLASMKPGSIVMDLAAASGGNCRATKPGETVQVGGVKLVGITNYPSRVAADATPLYARNLFHFVSTLMLDKSGALSVAWDDALIAGTCVVRGGAMVKRS